jgi:signal transduction histidine kinase
VKHEPAEEQARKRAIDRECVRLSLSHLTGIAFSTLVLATLLALIIKDRVPVDRLYTWLAATYLLVVARMVLAYLCQRRPRGDAELGRWLIWMAASLAASSLVWGSVVFVSVRPDDTSIYAVEALFLGGLIAGGAQSIVATPWLLVLTSTANVAPLLAFLLTSGVSGHPYIALTVLVYVAMVAQFARRNHRLLRESIALRFGNLDLVRSLTQEKARAEQARDAAERATEAKNQFLAAASHDIRQPIHAAFLFLGALEGRHGDRSDVLSKLRSSLVAARQMLDALLDVSRLDAGVVEREVVPFEARALAVKVLALFGPVAERKGLSLRLHVPDDLWLRSDMGLCERVLTNLTSNALKYTERGGALVSFRLRGERCLVQVWDTGVGIAPEDCDRVFDEFRQLGNPARDAARGIGLGLSIVKRLCALLGSAIELRSTVGRGSVFSFRLPLGERETRATVPEARRKATRRGHLLVVDDNRLICDGLRMLLGSWGYEVGIAHDVDEAGRVARSMKKLDLALVDYRLPGEKTASDAIRAIHTATGRRVPAIIITGDTHPQRIREASAAGHAVVFKPVPPDVLKEKLDSLLSAAPTDVVTGA